VKLNLKFKMMSDDNVLKIKLLENVSSLLNLFADLLTFRIN
jgi:hypothetical protein